MAEFLGKVTGLITTTSLCSLTGVSNGTNLSTGDIEWLKFKSNNKEILVSSRNIKNYISWEYLNSLECVDGKVIDINGKKYICRLLTGANANPSSTAGGEWDELLVNLTPSHVYYKHEYSWCIESHTNSSNAVVRGSSSLSNYGIMSKTTNSNNACWRPVLEEYIATATKLPQSASLKEAVSNISSILNLLKSNTSKLADNLIEKGVEANSEDKMSNLIDKVADINNYPSIPPNINMDYQVFKLCPLASNMHSIQTAVWGNYIILVGGSGTANNTGKKVQLYAPSTDTFKELTSYPGAGTLTGSHTCTVVNNFLYVAVGSEMYKLNLETNIWTKLPNLSGTVGYTRCCAIGNIIYIHALGDLMYKFDTSTDTVIGQFNFTLRQYTDIVHYNGKMYVAGGGSTSNPYISVLEINLETNTFSNISYLPNATTFHSTAIINDCMYIVGGRYFWQNSKNIIWKYSFLSKEWETISVSNDLSIEGFGGVTMNNWMYMFGGAAGSSIDRTSVFILPTK